MNDIKKENDDVGLFENEDALIIKYTKLNTTLFEDKNETKSRNLNAKSSGNSLYITAGKDFLMLHY